MTLTEMLDHMALASISRVPSVTKKITRRLQDYESRGFRGSLHDEVVWTFLCTYGYVTESAQGIEQLGLVLTEQQGNLQTAFASLEMQPLPPRQGTSGANEGNSEIDLIVGDVGMRGRQVSGVHYLSPNERNGWVCLVEAKYLSDIAAKTTYDPARNQMARVIETALTFQSAGSSGAVYPQEVHFTLLTPHRFKSMNCTNGGSRLYAYKFREYQSNSRALLEDIEAAAVPRRVQRGWQYPDLQQRLERLSLHWVTYEQMIHAMPEGDFKEALIQFILHQPGCLLDLSVITGSAA